MPHPILGELLVVFSTVIVVMLLLQRLRQSVIVGYLLTGIIVGPYGFGWVGNREAVDLMAEVGVALLLFMLGVEFSLKKLEQMRKLVLEAGGLQVLLTVASTLAVLALLGHPTRAGIFWGLVVALSSTAIVTKILMERGELTTVHGKISMAVLIFQDICVVPMMMMLPSLAPGEPFSAASLFQLAVKSVVTILGLFVGARYIFPFLLERIVRLHQKELFIIGVIVLALAPSWAAQSFGLTLGLGAFLAGLLFSESEYSHQVLTDLSPFRDIFSSLFFISIGMLIDIGAIGNQIFVVLGIGLAIVLGKALTTTLTVFAVRFPPRVALTVGFGLAQVGEFSFILLRQGRELNLITEDHYQIFLGATGLSILLAPMLIQLAPHLAFRARLPARLDRLFGPHLVSLEEEETSLKGHVIICGYGLNGRMLAQSLRSKKIPYLVLDVDGDLVRKARKKGERIFYGDCTRAEILRHAGIHDAQAVVFAITNPFSVGRAIQTARSVSEDVIVIVRTRHLSKMKELYDAGATTVVSEEFEAVYEILAHVLYLYGTLPDEVRRRIESMRATGSTILKDLEPSALQAPQLLRGFQSSAITVAGASDAAGRKLQELEIPESTGVLLVAVVRQGRVITNPPSDFEIQREDCLIVHGDKDQIHRAEELLREGKTATEG